MKHLLKVVFGQPSPERMQQGLAFLRIGIGLLTIPHGYPKFMGGQVMWEELGMFMYPLGIYFMPVMWGFLGAVTEFFGGIALVFGLGTRIASAALTFMMFVATVWHISQGDPYNLYSFPLSLIVVFVTFVVIGSGSYSLDAYLSAGRKVRRVRRKKSDISKA